jgi:hypothetical protein
LGVVGLDDPQLVVAIYRRVLPAIEAEGPPVLVEVVPDYVVTNDAFAEQALYPGVLVVPSLVVLELARAAWNAAEEGDELLHALFDSLECLHEGALLHVGTRSVRHEERKARMGPADSA